MLKTITDFITYLGELTAAANEEDGYVVREESFHDANEILEGSVRDEVIDVNDEASFDSYEKSAASIYDTRTKV